MKKLYALAITVLASSLAWGQSQRLCLLEEFTQASCPPCASQNPALNTLLGANTTKVASIKYQTNWPGVDPMNAQTQSWVGPRVSYYGVTGVPNICLDGNVIQKQAPSQLTQTGINNRYAVSSPFEFDLTHSFSADYDSVFINMLVTCTQATSGTFRARVSLVEQEIAFCNPPGTNGEDIFYGVMRKMYPNAIGTALATSYAPGDTFSLSFADAVPSFIYGFDQMAVVAFIQDDATKEVKQAGISNPLVISDYAVLKSCFPASVPALICTPTVNGISGELTNKGTSTITTADISYEVDGGAPATFTWTGSLASGGVTSFSLPPITISGSGSHSVVIKVVSVNGSPNPQCTDNRISLSFNANLTSVPMPVSQLFAAVSFPPAGWGINDASADNVKWTRAAQGSGGNNGSAKMDFYNSPTGSVDELFMPNIDMTGVSSANLTFKICKAPYTTASFIDNIKVNASSDCGANWNTVWDKSDPSLSTVAASGSAFTPLAASTWRLETVDLAAFIGQPNVSLVFKATSGYGNNAYLDEINVSLASGTGENHLEQQISLYPTPTTGTVFVDLSAIREQTVRITVTDVTGKVIETYVAEKNNRHTVNMENLQEGSYMIQVDADGQRIIKKVILKK